MQYEDPYSSSNGACKAGDASCNWVQRLEDKQKKENESPEEILKTQVEKTWEELSSEQQASLLGYQCGASCWAENQSGGVHDAEYWMDPLFYLESLVISAGTYQAFVGLATVNAEAGMVSIGSNGLYQKAGFTFFQLPDAMYKITNSVGLANWVNRGVMASQIIQNKPVIANFREGIVGKGTQMEIGMLRAAQYIESSANWLGADKIFQPSTWQWLR